jgi:IQ motif/SEC7 domain-containing protein
MSTTVPYSLYVRSKFVEDLRESIAEMDEMEQLRIEAELEKQQHSLLNRTTAQHDNRDSGINDLDIQDTQQR